MEHVQPIPLDGQERKPLDADSGLRREITALLPDLRAFARFLMRERSAADDLVQDTVVRALGALAQYQSGTNLKAWMFTILRNLFYEQARRRQREALALQAGFLPEEGAGPGQGHHAEVRDLQRMLWRLPPLQREALVLVGAQELTHEEAATICGVAVSTMRARVSRARGALAGMQEDAQVEP